MTEKEEMKWSDIETKDQIYKTFEGEKFEREI